jgi:2-polyprenyl-6-hydroxyphenyl methylase/3-demethylubiquinone-9 3-methyltransferase
MEKAFYQADSPEEAIEIYLNSDDELYGWMKNRIIQKILFEIRDQGLWNSENVLEVGAGGGQWTNFFVKRGANVTCVDTCEQILKGNKRLHPNAKFILSDATNVKLKQKFALIFAKDVIEHIPDDTQFLTNMNGHIKNDGLMIISTQNCWSLNFLIQGSYNFLKGNRDWCGWDQTHVRFYSVASLKRKLKSTGFKPVKWFGSYYFPYRILADRFGIRRDFRFFNFIELLNLYDKFPFSIIGWNIGVVARKLVIKVN